VLSRDGSVIATIIYGCDGPHAAFRMSHLAVSYVAHAYGLASSCRIDRAGLRRSSVQTLQVDVTARSDSGGAQALPFE